jgi:transcription-repair coupling factor (superfamily II helicase)
MESDDVSLEGDLSEREFPDAAGGAEPQPGAPGAELETGDEELRSYPEPNFESRYAIEDLVEAYESGVDHAQVLGATGGFRACVLADLSRRLDRPLVVLTAGTDDAERVADDLRLFASEGDEPDFVPEEVAGGGAELRDEVVHLPDFDVGPFHQASTDRRLTMERLGALYRLTRDETPRYTVASLTAASRRSMPQEAMELYSRRIEEGDQLSNETLRSVLSSCGFSEVPVVEDPGTFAVRGDIVDVYPPTEDHPIRLERWGDEVSDLRSFNAETQRTVEEAEACEVFPVREEVLDDPSVEMASRRLHQLADELKVPSREVKEIIQDLRAGLHFVGISALLPAVHEEPGDLFDYLDDDPLVVVVEPDSGIDALQSMWENRKVERERVVETNELAFPVEAYYRSPESVVETIVDAPARVEMRRVAMEPADDELAFPLPDREATFECRGRPNTDVVKLRKQSHGVEETVKELVGDLDEWKRQYGRICVACRTQGQSDRLVGLLENFGEDAVELPTPIDVTEPVPPPAELIEVYRGDLSSGFRSEILGLAVVAGSELFGSRVVTESEMSVAEHAEVSHFRDLEIGDHVVHVDFGIGRYVGLAHLEIGGVENDFLHIEYADGDRLYLPVHRLGRVQKYIGSEEQTRVDKLGGDRWEKTKEEVKEEIRDVASDLLELYAEREKADGYAFSGRDEFFREFEEDFPYEETPDQARAIEEVLEDMQRNRPMNRLICGDVGFGKTEVAMRATMNAVLDAKQVAVLVPTTILCEQHRLTFTERLEPYGVRVEVLSRFRTATESREIIEDTEAGDVDVLIGTHRLLSDDIGFRDLGLLVVDEEQRFGVKHKEKIKQLKANIDVLTLTATPIPRTLQMSLLGIRDLSIIATPPHNRKAVRTHVAKFSEGVVREAIMRELERGGQVFFVHNRVRTIEEMAAHLEEIVPEARIGIAHGQMAEGELEEVMLEYVNGDLHVLLCSTIIESGLDIPNANTIVINEANEFGLSQLYQLRGRVGRSDERAYAYLLVPRRQTLGKKAKKRLEVIQTHSDLGSGFHVATYDLEIRGAGNLLGEDQSGHVSKVGLDLYTELLDEAIHDLQDEEVEEEIEPEVNIPIDAFIPEEFIEETSLRLMFYKRFSLCRSQDELVQIFDELGDRFGDPPEPVQNLRDVVGVKIACRKLRAPEFDAGPSAIRIELREDTTLSPDKVREFVDETQKQLELRSDMSLVYSMSSDDPEDLLRTSRELVEQLLALRKNAVLEV